MEYNLINDKDNKFDYKIANVVSTSDLKQKIDIYSFNNYSWGRFDIENNYNGRVGYVKDSVMKGRVTVFLSGKIISTGARSTYSSIEQLEKTHDILLMYKFIKKTNIESKIRNIVATYKIKEFLFDRFIKTASVIYEPDQFPGAIFKTKHSTTILIFSNGKIVITGAKDEKQLINSIEDITTY